MSTTIYTKKGSRYIPVGEEWEGFPCNGIFVVLDARKNSFFKIGDVKQKEDIPKVNYNNSDLISYWENKISEQNGYSLRDIIQWGLYFISDIISEGKTTTFHPIERKKEKFDSRNLYIKEGSRYTELTSWRFSGWPVDGIWYSYKGSTHAMFPFGNKTEEINTSLIEMLCFEDIISEEIHNQVGYEFMREHSKKEFLDACCSTFNLIFK